MRLHTLFKTVVLSCCAVGFLSFVVPKEKPKADSYETERFQSARLSAAGDTLLLRSRAHDYEFSMPPNQLNAAFALDLGFPLRCHFERLSFDTMTQAAAVGFRAYFGSYVTLLTEDTRDALVRVGFVQSDRHTDHMAWTEGRDLSGRRYPAQNRPELTGADLSHCFENRGFIPSSAGSPPKLPA